MPRTTRRQALGRIEPRKQPLQARSQVMVERILNSAQKLAGEKGLQGISTVRIASRAGLSVGSLYQYFPNKESIVLELARRWLAPFRAILDRYSAERPPRAWRTFAARFRAMLDECGVLYRDSAVALPILQLMGASAELRQVEHEHDEAVVEILARWFCGINPQLAKARATHLGMLVLGVGHVVLSAAAASPEKAARLEEDLSTMLLAVLKPNLGLR